MPELASKRISSRAGRSLVVALGFMVGVTALLLLVISGYLLPATEAARNVDSTGRKQFSVLSMLVLAILVICSLIGLILSMRIRRYFAIPGTQERVKTEYVDAWAESAKRMNVEAESDNDEESPPRP